MAMLGTPAIDVWVASADIVNGAMRAHLVPLSLAWIGERVVIAVGPAPRRATSASIAWLGSGSVPTRDVVMIDAVLEDSIGVAEAPPALADGYAAQADWDTRTADGYVYIVLRPERIQAWRESNELSGRTLMRAGCWVV
ncbi:MAG TPA: pyridoxamine 5'-phosphate oxidase family protein [Propionibacteriaceae bacterium]|nr:pyridoxamine 5'-phosphate oxidase family protein [Propionibacteriaceae bacterium]